MLKVIIDMTMSRLGGASPRRQAVAEGLVDETLVHVAAFLLGDGVRLIRCPAA